MVLEDKLFELYNYIKSDEKAKAVFSEFLAEFNCEVQFWRKIAEVLSNVPLDSENEFKAFNFVRKTN